MCMQDLIINRAISWQRTEQKEFIVIGGTTMMVVPPNPNRVAAIAYDSVNGNLSAWRIQTVQGAVTTIPLSNGQGILSSYLTIANYPGIFGLSLLIPNDPNPVVLYEAVMDPALAAVVSKGYTDLLAAQGK